MAQLPVVRLAQSPRPFLLAIVAATVVVPTGRVLAQQAEPHALRLFPDGLLYDSYRAGVKEPRLSGALAFGADGTTYFDAVLGARFGVVRFGTEGASAAEGWQLDIEGAAYPRLNLDEVKESFESADFRFGFPLTYRKGWFAAKAGYYHVSSHVGDEYLQRTPGFERINYVRDSFLYGVAFDMGSRLRTYAEVGYAFYTSGGAEPWELQLGAEYGRTFGGCECGGPFVAINGHLREELDFGGSVTAIAGWEWNRADSGERVRLGILYFRGDASQYQFLGRHEELLGPVLSIEL